MGFGYLTFLCTFEIFPINHLSLSLFHPPPPGEIGKLLFADRETKGEQLSTASESGVECSSSLFLASCLGLDHAAINAVELPFPGAGGHTGCLAAGSQLRGSFR